MMNSGARLAIVKPAYFDHMAINDTSIKTERVHQAWSAMLDAMRALGATIISAEEGGALGYSIIEIGKAGVDLTKVEEALFNNRLHYPMSIQEKADRWEIFAAQLWNERPVETWKKERSPFDHIEADLYNYKPAKPFPDRRLGLELLTACPDAA